MKNKWILVPVLSALSIFAACSKSDPSEDPTPQPPVPGVDSSKCKLSNVEYPYDTNLPYSKSSFYIYYDSLNRISQSSNGGTFNMYTYETGKITQRSYINTIADSNLSSRHIYTMDNNQRIVSKAIRYYIKPKSENDYNYHDRVDYEYDAEGYLTNVKTYASGTVLTNESKFSYLDGNLARRENISYSFSPAVKDTFTYTYNNMPWVAEAAYLYEMGEYSHIPLGKPNKNNVTGIQCNMYQFKNSSQYTFKSIQYFYSMKGPKLEKVYMTATSTKGIPINTSVNFNYNCR